MTALNDTVVVCSQLQMSLDPLTLAANTDYANWKAGKAGNDGTYPKWPLLEAEFVELMDCNSEQVRVKWVADNNSRVRMNEVPMTEGAVYAILVCAANNNFASRTFDEVPMQYVGNGSIEGVLLLRQTANGQPNDIEPWKVVALEHSLLKQRSAEVWPSVPNVDVPDPNSDRKSVV